MSSDLSVIRHLFGLSHELAPERVIVSEWASPLVLAPETEDAMPETRAAILATTGVFLCIALALALFGFSWSGLTNALSRSIGSATTYGVGMPGARRPRTGQGLRLVPFTGPGRLSNRTVRRGIGGSEHLQREPDFGGAG
jgi:hypothetical protein